MTQFWILEQMPDLLRESADGRKWSSDVADTTTWTSEATKEALETPEISAEWVEIINDPEHFQADRENWESIVLWKITKTPEKWWNSRVMRHKVYEARLKAVINYYYNNLNELWYPSTHRIMWELNDQWVLWDIESLLRDEFEDKAEVLIWEWKITLVDSWIDIQWQEQIQAISPDRNKVRAFVFHIVKGITVSFIKDWVISGTQYEDYRSIEQLARVVWIDVDFLWKMHSTSIGRKTETFREILKDRWVESISEPIDMILTASEISDEVFWENPFR